MLNEAVKGFLKTAQAKKLRKKLLTCLLLIRRISPLQDELIYSLIALAKLLLPF